MRFFDQSRVFSTMGNERRVPVFNRPRTRPRFLIRFSAGTRRARLPRQLSKSRTRTIWLWLRRTMIRATTARIAVQFLNIALFAAASPAQDAQNPSTAVSRGKQIYLYGTGYNGVAIEALAGENRRAVFIRLIFGGRS